MHSLGHRSRPFPYILSFIMGFHALVMLIQLQEQLQSSSFVPEKPLQVKLIQETLKDQVASPKRQIVQSEDSAAETKPQEAFLSDKDRSFERETMARAIDKFKKAAKGNSSHTDVKKQQTAKTQKKAFKDLTLSDFGMEAGVEAEKIARTPASEAQKGLQNGDEQSEGLSASNDYVEEIALGDFTHLNTVEYKYYGYFHRIRQKLEQFWGKSIQEKAGAIFRAGRRLPASENLITSLQITLNTKGEIIGVKILGSSGVKELDDAAIESFNAAGPFPNPPKDLLVKGKAVIEWGFVIKS